MLFPPLTSFWKREGVERRCSFYHIFGNTLLTPFQREDSYSAAMPYSFKEKQFTLPSRPAPITRKAQNTPVFPQKDIYPSEEENPFASKRTLARSPVAPQHPEILPSSVHPTAPPTTQVDENSALHEGHLVPAAGAEMDFQGSIRFLDNEVGETR